MTSLAGWVAYDPVNRCLETTTFPLADPEEAFRQAAGRSHHTVIDAIWVYTQFFLDEITSRIQTVCAKSGLHQMPRMPFAQRQHHRKCRVLQQGRFCELRDPETGWEIYAFH